MKIVIDARMYQESGIGRYLRNLIGQLQEQDTENNYLILLLKKDFETLDFKKNFTKVLVDFRWYTITEQIKLPKILHDLKPNLIHFPHFNVPILYDGKFVVTIHDLIHQHYSMERSSTHGKLIFNAKKFGYNKVFEIAIKKSLKILVPSYFVKDQLINEWKIGQDKIMVTPEAVDDKISRSKKNVRLPEKVRPPYIFYVGNAHPHKNIEGLIQAFLKLRKIEKNLQLVLSGKENYFWEYLKKKYSNPDIIYTGFVTDEELVAFYKNAEVYIEPSLEEGFGLPLLEAFSLGCPVVASDVGSLKEVGGDAVHYFISNDVDDLVTKIEDVLNNKELRKDLVEKGKKRVKLFSWEKMVEQTLEVYRKCV